MKKLTKLEIEAIIAKLPVTIDGMPVVPDCDVIYSPELLHPETKKPVALNYSDYDHNWIDPWTDSGRFAEQCYSTEALAFAAIKKYEK